MSDLATGHQTAKVTEQLGTVLRVGILVDSLVVPAWVRRAVEEVIRLPHARVVLVGLPSAHAIATNNPHGTRRGWRYLLLDLYERFDRRWFKDARLDPFESTTLTPVIGGAARIEVRASPDGRTMSPDTVSAIREQELDVLLRFGLESVCDVPAGLAKHGVWSIDANNASGQAGFVGGFWEVLRGSPVNESTLDVRAGAGNIRTIYRSFGSTWPVSVWKTRRERFWKVAAFMARKLRDLSEQGEPGIAAVPVSKSDEAEAARQQAPSNIRLVSLVPRVVTRYAAIQFDRRAYFEQWFVAYDFASAEPREEGVPATSFRNFRHLQPPNDRLWADPFPIRYRGQHYLFLEEMLFARNRGHISVVEFENGNALRPERVLETPNHLSYPFVLPWRGEMFLIPESARSGNLPTEQAQLSIPVYRAQSFPSEWVQEAAMLEDLEVFDPTLAEIGGRWWLFCAQGELGASSWDELHLFYAPTPLGPWTPHRRNPVKSDVRSARPAGRLFQRDGEWYRPAQDCSVRYGYAISINRITRLTPTEYEEVVVQHIAPDWAPNLIGTHTLNAAGRLTVVDGFQKRWRWSGDAAPLPQRSG